MKSIISNIKGYFSATGSVGPTGRSGVLGLTGYSGVGGVVGATGYSGTSAPMYVCYDCGGFFGRDEIVELEVEGKYYQVKCKPCNRQERISEIISEDLEM